METEYIQAQAICIRDRTAGYYALSLLIQRPSLDTKMTELLDSFFSPKLTGGIEKPKKSPELRRKKSWIGSAQFQGTTNYDYTGQSIAPAAGELKPEDRNHARKNSHPSASNTDTSGSTALGYHNTRTDDFAPHGDRKTAIEVTFEPASKHTKPTKRGSWGIGGLISLLRGSKFQQVGSFEGGPVGYSLEADSDMLDENNDSAGNAKLARHRHTDCRDYAIDPSSHSPKGNGECRNVSERTALSRNSGETAVTVYHDPTKRTSAPIVTLGPGSTYGNPFDEAEEYSYPLAACNPFADQAAISTQSTRQPSSVYSDHASAMHYQEQPIDRPENPIAKSCSFISTSLSTGSSHQTNRTRIDSSVYLFSNDSRWSDEFNHRNAVEAFNELAKRLNLQPLTLDDGRQSVSGEESHEPAVQGMGLRRRDRVLGRIRVMRSSLTIRAQARSQERRLRRMKTFASLPSRSPQMVSLRGKPLVTLARLGGYSFLELPRDFAPGPLKLPACFVSMARHLRSYAPSVRNVFFDPGDAKKTIQLYDYFANQVLAAECESNLIEITMRGSKMPLELESPTGRLSKGWTQVHSVASVFKALLDGLPGGILGSPELYRVLVEVYYARSSECDLQWTDSCTGEVQIIDSAKIQAIAHAIMALTSGLQLELICAVFGECALLLYETGRITESEPQDQGNKTGARSLSGLMTLDRLARVFGPLLQGESTTEDNDKNNFQQIEKEIERERVASMMIGQWRQVSRRLREEQRQQKRPQRQQKRREYRLESWGGERPSCCDGT